jgi:hypothetical protein
MTVIVSIIENIAAFFGVIPFDKIRLFLVRKNTFVMGWFRRDTVECKKASTLLSYFGVLSEGRHTFSRKMLVQLVSDLQKSTALLMNPSLQVDPEIIVDEDAKLHVFLQAAHHISLVYLLREKLPFETKDFSRKFSELVQRAELLLTTISLVEISLPERGSPFVTCIPKPIFSMKTLRRLNLRGSSIRWIPDDIAKLERLCVLDVSATSICALPPGVCRLPHLEEFACSYTPLQSIPESFFDNERLKIIRLNNNRELKKIPDLFDKLKDIEFLDVAECSSLKRLPKSICSYLSPAIYVPGQYHATSSSRNVG